MELRTKGKKSKTVTEEPKSVRVVSLVVLFSVNSKGYPNVEEVEDPL